MLRVCQKFEGEIEREIYTSRLPVWLCSDIPPKSHLNRFCVECLTKQQSCPTPLSSASYSYGQSNPHNLRRQLQANHLQLW